METESKNTSDFFRVATWSTCIGFAAMGALMGSMRETANDFHLEFSLGTILWAAAGLVSGWLLWRTVRAVARRQE